MGDKKPRKTLIFCASVGQADQLAAILNRWIPDSAVTVNGKMSRELRTENLRSFTAGTSQFMVNCMVLTEGADLPGTEVVVMARPTKSRSLYSQMLGRGTRPAEVIAHALGDCESPELRCSMIAESAKPYLEVLDFVGNCGKHKLVSSIDILGGNESPEVLELAKGYAGEESVSVFDAIQKARKQKEEIEQREE